MLLTSKFLHVVHKNVVGGSSMIRYLVVIAESLQEMPGIKPGPLGRHTKALTTELMKVEVRSNMVILKMLCGRKMCQFIEDMFVVYLFDLKRDLY